ncbi:winged helix-turn-helix domain-containing protein [Solicola gregarius]|uniref:Winged helix-turn-helix domain-containing protein n=1 Tax=Solicola gregarius TaxID=2908642 RepID=A0AA46TM79_9ACTN|nr:winged helix-turn-helix domain-containing protein [Solicola gregarius]UYM07504.1 winged helix-turn-helix domain-containing protein [Solicola gregarius]
MTTDRRYDTIHATSPAQMRALSHPARHKLLGAMNPDGATISQLSNRLGMNKGSVSHHLGVLCAAGLAHKGPTRTVRGGTEQYFVPTARKVMFPPGEDGAATNAMLATITEELGTDDDHLLNHRVICLTRDQAEAVRQHLDAVVNDLQPADPRERQYGIVVGLYQRR